MARVAGLLLVVAVLVASCDQISPSTTTGGSSPSVVEPASPPTSDPTVASSTTDTSARDDPAPPETTADDPSAAASTTVTLPAEPLTPVATQPIAELTLALEEVASGFTQPVLAIAPQADDRLFVVDQPGRIWVLEGGDVSVFLDLRDVVRFRREQGLLGLAFHPDHAENGLFYVHFTADSGETVISEFGVDASDPNLALPGSRRDVLLVAQPAANHNGGMIAFGPDGLLWVGLGDGGGSNDRYRNGQRADRRLASMLRIEVGPDATEPYDDPPDGPFFGDGSLPEVWAIGLRNPWRWAFDGDDLYIADVGQSAIEEINVVSTAQGGLNFGWPFFEGNNCVRTSGCDTDGLQDPVLTYDHSEGCSVTGGFVYRGELIPELDGHYFFGDFCSGWVESIVVGDSGQVDERYEWFPPGAVGGLTSFGIDARGELYVMTTAGALYRIVRG